MLSLAWRLQAGVKLRKAQEQEEKPAAKAPAGGSAFVPNPADLLKLKAGGRAGGCWQGGWGWCCVSVLLQGGLSWPAY